MSSSPYPLHGDPDPELTRWLVEAGQRRAARRLSVLAAAPTAAVERVPAMDARPLRRLLILAVLALSTLQYLYADTTLTIVRLPTLIVFAGPASAQ